METPDPAAEQRGPRRAGWRTATLAVGLALVAAGLAVAGARTLRVDAWALATAAGATSPSLGAPTFGGSADELATRMAGLEAALDRTELRLALLEERAAQSAGALASAGSRPLRALAASVALLQLQERVGAGGPYVAALEPVRRLVEPSPEDDAALTTLIAFAPQGVPTIEDLGLQFQRLLPVLRAQVERMPILDRGRALVRALLVEVHLAEPAAPDPRRVLLAQAQVAIRTGHLEAGVAALDRLDVGTRAAASGWIGAARARIAVDRSVDDLLQGAVARMSDGT